MVTLADLLTGRSRLAVVGLGYVGLPLAVALGRKFPIIGYDISVGKIEELGHGIDHTGEVSPDQMEGARIEFTADPSRLAEAAFFIVTVPTPIDGHRRPDLGPLKAASTDIGRHLSRGAIVVFESTVYPGATEEICLPILEKESGLVGGRDFKIGYSPERINPGDKVHSLEKVVKVVAGQDPKTLETVADLYQTVVAAGIHRVSSIKVAEAAKVIENTQRDLNVALMNELALIFNRLGISTREVLEAAGTKWNFLPFSPGLVGGHCIGVDPYYLTFKAEEIGYHPKVILAGRQINDGMGKYVAEMAVKKLIEADKAVKGSRLLILGLTFKENVPDIRNTKVIDIVTELNTYGVEGLVCDPVADPEEVRTAYGFDLVDWRHVEPLDGVIWAVAHDAFRVIGPADLNHLCRNGKGSGVVCDVKSLLDRAAIEAQGLIYWSL